MTKRALILEDEKAQRVAEETLLHSMGWETVSVGSAEDGIAVVRGGAVFDVVVLDLVMSGKSGLDFVAEVGSKFPIVLTTGYWEGGNIPGVVAILKKPFDLVEFELEMKRIERNLETL